MPKPHSSAPPRSVRESLKEYSRGIAGGLLFSLPLLYTMEVWWRGFTASPATLLIYLGLTFIVLLGYNRYSGMRRSASLGEVMIDSVEEMGLGIIIAAGVLYLMGQITPGMPFGEVLGKIVIEAMTVAIGVSVGTAQLGSGGKGETGADPSHGSPEPGGGSQQGEQGGQGRDGQSGHDEPDAWGQLVLGFCGAILIASNVAPTEEIVRIAVETTPAKLLGLAVVSLALCALVLSYSGFIGSDQYVRSGAAFWTAYGIVSSYGLALAASALMLWFFGRFEGALPPVIVAQTVVLGLPAALGASAGRLLIQ